jgi:hypothetical protein
VLHDHDERLRRVGHAVDEDKRPSLTPHEVAEVIATCPDLPVASLLSVVLPGLKALLCCHTVGRRSDRTAGAVLVPVGASRWVCRGCGVFGSFIRRRQRRRN